MVSASSWRAERHPRGFTLYLKKVIEHTDEEPENLSGFEGCTGHARRAVQPSAGSAGCAFPGPVSSTPMDQSERLAHRTAACRDYRPRGVMSVELTQPGLPFSSSTSHQVPSLTPVG